MRYADWWTRIPQIPLVENFALTQISVEKAGVATSERFSASNIHLAKENLKQHGTAEEKTWHITQLAFSSSFYWNVCVKICILGQNYSHRIFHLYFFYKEHKIDAQISMNNGPTNRGWSACYGISILSSQRKPIPGRWGTRSGGGKKINCVFHAILQPHHPGVNFFKIAKCMVAHFWLTKLFYSDLLLLISGTFQCCCLLQSLYQRQSVEFGANLM